MVEQLSIVCGKRDDRGRMLVTATLGKHTHVDRFDPLVQFTRKKFREAVVDKFQLGDDAHESVELAIIRACEATDSDVTSLTKAELIRLSDVTPEEVEWLWEGRIAIGKVTMIAGDPGRGKSFLTTDIAARVTTGRSWPDDRDSRQPVGSVIMLSAEDDLGDTIRPRLDAHGADVSKIAAIKSIRGSDALGEYKRTFDLSRDIECLRTAAAGLPDCRLITVDPISAYMGKVDSHKNAEVRNVLAPLAELAADLRVAVLAVTHLRKGEGAAIYRTMGSLAFVAAARACWIVADDPADRRRRLMLPTKNNLAPDVQGLAFRIEPHGANERPAVCWEAGAITVSADDAMAPKRGPKPDVRDEAAKWLREQLRTGSALAKDLIEMGDHAGFTKRTLQRAYRDLGGTANRDGFGGPVRWSLPIRATNDANSPCGSQRGVNGTTWRECENPEEEEEVKASSLANTPYVPSSERQAWPDDFDAINAE